MYEVEIINNVFIPLQSGELAASLCLPKGGPAAPALITLIPYSKDWYSGTYYWQSHQYFAQHGYASVLIDCRGTGSSAGIARAPFDGTESDDGVAAVEWAAKQAWCDGNVGMWGISYGGITSMRTASRRPVALKAIVPIMGTLDVERDFVHPYGTPGCIGPLGWALQMLLLQLAPPMHMDTQGRWRRVWNERLRDAAVHFADFMKHKPGDPVWRSRLIDASRIAVPSLCVVGWRDLFVDGMIRAYEEIPAQKHLLAGPWMHALPHASPFSTIDFLPIMRRWWDRWLRGIQNGVENEAPVTAFVQGSNQWRGLKAWPPKEARFVKWFAGVDGALQSEPEKTTGCVRRSPDATIGVGAGLPKFYSFGYGMPVDQSDDDRRGISFTSSRLREALAIFGRAQLRVQVNAGGATEGTVVAKLADVYADGRSIFITSGVASLSERGNDGALTIELAATSYEIVAGHQLRLMIANGDFPRLWPDPNPPQLLVLCGGAQATELHLPVAQSSIGEPVTVAAADPKVEVPPHFLKAAPPEYDVTRDLKMDSVTVKVVTDITARSTDFANTVHFAQSVSASVSAGRPGEAHFTGNATLEINTAGDDIRVTAAMFVTQSSAAAEGEVVIGGETKFAGSWSVQRT